MVKAIKKRQIALLLLTVLLCTYALVACVEMPGDVTIEEGSWKPNDRNETTTPGNGNNESGTVEEPDGNGVGIGENAPVELPFLPVS